MPSEGVRSRTAFPENEAAGPLLPDRRTAVVNKTGSRINTATKRNDSTVLATSAYLDKLNPRQRQAVEHGIGTGVPAAPLLVIAGAGSGKTSTLAHRVAHLVVNGVDPRRILLLTFSRRAAAEMARRVERI